MTVVQWQGANLFHAVNLPRHKTLLSIKQQTKPPHQSQALKRVKLWAAIVLGLCTTHTNESRSWAICHNLTNNACRPPTAANGRNSKTRIIRSSKLSPTPALTSCISYGCPNG